jgi:hypothetical protein
MRAPVVFVVIALAGCRGKWRSAVEFDLAALDGHEVRHPQSYERPDAEQVAGAFVATLARPGVAARAFRPYTACLDPADARKPFRFSGTFVPGWMESGAQLGLEFQGGPRWLFCLDTMVVNVSRFPCFTCPAEKYLSLSALNHMRERCGEPPLVGADAYDHGPDEARDLEKVRGCYLAR